MMITGNDRPDDPLQMMVVPSETPARSSFASRLSACYLPATAVGDPAPAKQIHRVALEANGGYFSSKGVKVGDRLMWEVGEP